MYEAWTILAQAARPEASVWVQFVPIVLMLVVFYFLLVAPMRKRQRETEAMLGALKRGDRVITSGGLHGEIAGVEGGIVHLKVADGVKLRVSKSAITQVEDRGATP
jgi:preprotein translocase subunit YajC